MAHDLIYFLKTTTEFLNIFVENTREMIQGFELEFNQFVVLFCHHAYFVETLASNSRHNLPLTYIVRWETC